MQPPTSKEKKRTKQGKEKEVLILRHALKEQTDKQKCVWVVLIAL